MGRIIDLRSYNIKTDDDVVEFLELFEQKIPQIKNYIKKQKLRRVSLNNQVTYLNGEIAKGANLPQYETINPDASVLDRVQGNTRPIQSDEQKRLAQLRQAQTIEETVEVDPLAPAAPGEIGHLEVPAVEGHAPTEEDVAEAAGSKSERPADDDVQQEVDTSEVEEKVYTQFQLGDDVYQQIVKGDDVRYTKNGEDISGEDFGKAQADTEGAPAPSAADVKPVGELVAEKTDNGKNR